jgi:hypothetical protein
MTTGEGGTSGPNSHRARGQSEVVGAVLILGIMLLGAAAVVGLGATALDGTENKLSDDRAEKTLTQFDSKAGLVALGEASSQRVSLPTEAGEQFSVVDDTGWLRVSVTNLSDESDSFDVMNSTLGKVVYENENGTLAYQGGGVWSANDQGGSMVSPPEFHYRNGTLTLPSVTVTGEGTLGPRATIEKVDEQRQFPDPSITDRLNPLDNHRVEVTVRSDYYKGWGQYFIKRTDGSVDYDHANESVTVTLVTPINVNEITAASASLSAGGEFNVSGSSASTCGKSGADDVFTSSFNSSNGSYCSQFSSGTPPGDDGDVVYGKDIDISDGTGGSDFYGDIVSGQTVTIDDSSGAGQPDVYGNISYADSCLPSGECDDRIVSGSGGSVNEIDGIRLTESIGWFIDTSIEDIRSNADATNPTIAGATLDDGQYYFDDLNLGSGDTLQLDTSDGPVIIAVNGTVSLADSAEISVVGDAHVELYVGGEDGVDDLTMDDKSKITTNNNNATKFRTYGDADFKATLGGGGSGNLAVYTGVIYAPPGSTGAGTVTLDGAEVFGGILAGQTTIKGGSIHYDKALEGKRVVPEEARIIRVTYLHVSESTISVTS